jgi:hypothetical protein
VKASSSRLKICALGIAAIAVAVGLTVATGAENAGAPWTISGRQLRIVDDEPDEISAAEPVMPKADRKEVAARIVDLLVNSVQPAATPNRPEMADAFKPFEDKLKLRWDDQYLFVGSDGFPDHQMMVGITAWQQQVPIPQSYFGKNAWQIPLHPVVADNLVSIKGRFLRGAIALAVNGVPIFNPQNNRGVVSKDIGELDEFGGHCGRADDYHYHIAPMFLEKIVGKGKPIACALDGYPIYASTGPDGLPVDPKTLDEFHGKTDSSGHYAYYASDKYPFVNGGFHGKVTEKEGQVDPQPRAEPIRPAGRPLRGAKITSFKVNGKNSYTLKYEVNEEVDTINYTIGADGTYHFEFIDGSGKTTTEDYRRGHGPGGQAHHDNGGPPPR